MGNIIGILLLIAMCLMTFSGGIVLICSGGKNINKYSKTKDSEWLGLGVMSIVCGICLIIGGVASIIGICNLW